MQILSIKNILFSKIPVLRMCKHYCRWIRRLCTDLLVLASIRCFQIRTLMDHLNITIEFGGGAELLFNNKKSYDINLPGSAWNIGALLHWMTENLLKERPELFIQNKSVRPGILVLVNDADWELLNTTNYAIQSNDRITFLSTLHGG